MSGGLRVVPLTLKEANDFVRRVHRHHKPTIGGKFAIGVADADGEVRGVAIAGRPVSRMLDNGWTIEVNRVATDGAVANGATRNVPASRTTPN